MNQQLATSFPKRIKLDLPNSLDPLEDRLIVKVPEIQLPNDEPEIYRLHPKYPLSISTLGKFKANDKFIGKGISPTVEVREPISGKLKAKQKIDLMAETYLGLRPSNRHFATYRCKANGLILSNLHWTSMGTIINLSAMTESDHNDWHPLAKPFTTYHYSSKGQIRRGNWLLKLNLTSDGYLQVALQTDNSNDVTRKVHIVIAEACFGPRPKNYDVAHLDNNKLNCAPSNLAYQTKSDNQRQRAKEFGLPLTAWDQLDTKISFSSVGQTAQYFSVNTSVIFNRLDNGKTLFYQNAFWKFNTTTSALRTCLKQQKIPSNCIWVPGLTFPYTNYEFSVNGLVRRIQSDRMIRTCQTNGYLRVRLEGSLYYLHLVMLDVFHGPRPGPDFEGDHIDENKLHNCKSNLQWTTKNIERSTGKVCLCSLDKKSWEQFPSLKTAVTKIKDRGLPISCRSIKHAISNSTQAAGFFWKFANRLPSTTYFCKDCDTEWQKRGAFLAD